MKREYETETKALEDIKEQLESKYSPECTRNWLEASTTDSYGDPQCRVTVWALYGSPPKAIIVLDSAMRIIRAFNGNFEPVGVSRYLYV